MGLKKFKIILDSPVFFAGQTVRGKLRLTLDKPTKIRGIKLKYSGDGRVRWTEIHMINGSPATYTYSDDETYFKHEEIVFSSFDLKDELDVGEHVFDFESDLPKHLPNSFEGRYGRIRYSVKGVIDVPKRLTSKTKVPFTVVSLLDLNKDPIAANPVNEEKVKTFWGHLKPLTVKLSLPVRGYVPGQVIPVKALVTNDTGVEIKKLRVQLKKITNFHTKLKTQEVKEVITECDLHLEHGHGKEEASIDLKVPALPPSRMEYCKIIDIDYKVIVEACVESWYHKNMKTVTDIVIGSVPLLCYQIPVAAFPLSRSPPTLHSEFRPLGDQPPAQVASQPYQDIYGGEVAIPIYEETMEYPSEKREKHKKKEKEDGDQSAKAENVGIEDADSDGEVTSFAPLYPVFKFGTRNNDAS
ncbi:arrestin domain-containing protein 3 [Neodiprion lecontei]|uniref:Arrestin domain-containing protein 3 n=1 Tax=Neodiprion lecontei TaxID=441921 RepID=A0A6J0BUP0_NEOLC|nr:arrestin domain-containing protein 3 [Neodiprion lecontei]